MNSIFPDTDFNVSPETAPRAQYRLVEEPTRSPFYAMALGVLVAAIILAFHRPQHQAPTAPANSGIESVTVVLDQIKVEMAAQRALMEQFRPVGDRAAECLEEVRAQADGIVSSLATITRQSNNAVSGAEKNSAELHKSMRHLHHRLALLERGIAQIDAFLSAPAALRRRADQLQKGLSQP